MPISGDQQMNEDQTRYSLPLDSCVGDDGPTPDEAMNMGGPAKVPYADAKTIGTAPIGYTYP